MTEDKIKEMFNEGFDCGQVVLSTISSKLGVDDETSKKVSSCFGGGMFCGQTCGAVTGAYMAIGLKYGHYQSNTPEIKNKMIDIMGEFNNRFLEKYSSTSCKELLGYDISKTDEMNIIVEKGLLKIFCPKVVHNSIMILNEII